VLTGPGTAHFVGIGGIGVSALARMLLRRGWQVTGSDLRASEITDDLSRHGARIHIGHGAAHVGNPDFVVYTAAARDDNPELQAARRRGIPTIKRAELLGHLMAGKRGIAVAGTHGKTTTTALIGLALVRAGLDPTVFIGGEAPELGGNYREGSGDLLVAEADEFDGSFLKLKPEIAVITNIEPEHLDFYGDFEHVKTAFHQFMEGATGPVVYCADDPVLQEMLPDLRPEAPQHAVETREACAVSYGIQQDAQWRAQDLRPNDAGGFDFLASLNGAPFGSFSLRIPGRHNVSNALAAIAVVAPQGVSPNCLQAALREFGGVKRRFQVLGTSDGVTVVDDYAHHPTEVRATLAAARARYPGRRIQCLFQPHTYSRTRTLMPLFADAFVDADKVWITEIYPAREENLWDVTGEELSRNIRHPAIAFVGDLHHAGEQVLPDLEPGDVLLLLGAGDIYHLGPVILASSADSE